MIIKLLTINSYITILVLFLIRYVGTIFYFSSTISLVSCGLLSPCYLWPLLNCKCSCFMHVCDTRRSILSALSAIELHKGIMVTMSTPPVMIGVEGSSRYLRFASLESVALRGPSQGSRNDPECAMVRSFLLNLERPFVAVCSIRSAPRSRYR